MTESSSSDFMIEADGWGLFCVVQWRYRYFGQDLSMFVSCTVVCVSLSLAHSPRCVNMRHDKDKKRKVVCCTYTFFVAISVYQSCISIVLCLPGKGCGRVGGNWSGKAASCCPFLRSGNCRMDFIEWFCSLSMYFLSLLKNCSSFCLSHVTSLNVDICPLSVKPLTWFSFHQRKSQKIIHAMLVRMTWWFSVVVVCQDGRRTYLFNKRNIVTTLWRQDGF